MSNRNEHMDGVDVLVVRPDKVYQFEGIQGLIRGGDYLVPTLIAYIKDHDARAGVGKSDLSRSITGLPDRGTYCWKAGRGRTA